MKTLTIFCWSRDLPVEKTQELDIFLDELFSCVKWKVSGVIYWWWQEGVMWKIVDYCEQSNIPLHGYVLEKYKRSTDPIWTKYFPGHIEQVSWFVDDSDAFLALPGWFGTVREVLHVNELLKAIGKQNPIFVPQIFTAFYNMLEHLIQDNMIAHEDLWNITKLEKIETLENGL